MFNRLRLYDENRRSGSYMRRDLKGDVLYSTFHHRDIYLHFGALGSGTTHVEDELTAQMLRAGLISAAQKATADAHIQAAFSSRDLIERFDDYSVEEIYRYICQLRREAIDAQAFSAWQKRPCCVPDDYLIDQRALKQSLLERSAGVLFMLFDTAWLAQMREDIAAAKALGKQVYILCGEKAGDDLPEQSYFDGIDAHFLTAASQADLGTACLFAYGEEALLHCRGLSVDAFIHARPTGYYARALINALDAVRSCAVYVPAHLDITRYVPLRERMRLSYLQLYHLQKDFGDSIYTLSVEELYRRHPQYFTNIYDSRAVFSLPVTLQEGENIFAQHDLAREAAVKSYLDGFSNLTFSTHYFDPSLAPAPLPYGQSTPGRGLLVHALRVKAARNACVLSRAENTPLRQMFSADHTGVFSNFLFFMTPKLATLYNTLRDDRPLEQADVTAGHLDYKLCYEDGRRIETFPLFGKMCMAMKDDGTFLFFNFRLGGGRVRVGSHTFVWTKENVNVTDDAPVIAYTPALSCADADADRQTYRRMVGDGRVNLVILQERIHCIRSGDVVLPSVGVVISLRHDVAQQLLSALKPLENGYFDAAALDYAAQLDAPEGIDPSVWQHVRWAYGGGLSLICNGQSLCDCPDMAAWFDREGWMSPLSRQTQESALHTLSRHPRTAIGQAQNGDMLLMVFSGRTSLSVGADYVEMCRIAQQIAPDVSQLMNVDGGASAVLCLVKEGTMLELNCPSTSSGSCAGMARPIKTLLYIPAE